MSTSRPREERTTQEQIGALVDEGLLRLLQETFPPLEVLPGVSLDAVMFDAGTQRLVRYLAECRHSTLRDQ